MNNEKPRATRRRCRNGEKWVPHLEACLPKDKAEEAIVEMKKQIKEERKTNRVNKTKKNRNKEEIILNENPSGIEENIITDNEIPFIKKSSELSERISEPEEDKSVIGNVMSFFTGSDEIKEQEQGEGEEQEQGEGEGEEQEQEQEQESVQTPMNNNEEQFESKSLDEDEEYELDQNNKITSVFNKNNQNEEKFTMEKNEFDKNQENNDNMLYPDLDDPNFNTKIASKKEFKNYRFDGKIEDIPQRSKYECDSSFEILPHQQFVKNFISMDTPYNSALLYHELGTGKTCSAIGITEQFRIHMKQSKTMKKIIIIASPNVQQNFKKQLFDSSKLEYANGIWNLNTCVGESLLKEINPTQIQEKGDDVTKSKKRIKRSINALIKQYYTFTGYEAIANYSQSDQYKLKKQREDEDENDLDTLEIIDLEPINIKDTNEEKKRKTEAIKRLRYKFDNRVIVIDEVHNMIARKNTSKISSKILYQIVRFCLNTKFIFLSATPLYNSHEEIIWITNIMNINDKRAYIQEQDVFDTYGDFKKEVIKNNVVLQESGEDLLRRKLTGYVSYVRGENPYTFPYRIYPETFAKPENKMIELGYPEKQFNGMNIEVPPQLHVLNKLFVSTLTSHQRYAYEQIIGELQRKVTDFNEKTKFNFEILQSPISVLNMSYPREEGNTYISSLFGKDGIQNVMTFDKQSHYTGEGNNENKTSYSYNNFEYKDWVINKHGRIFHPDKIGDYSCKIKSICDAVQNSTGVVLIYSKYLFGGLLPVALALEEMGLKRYSYASHVGNFMNNESSVLDALTMKPAKPNETKYIAKYSMITGSKIFSPNNDYDLDLIMDKDNYDGKHVKVVMISEAGSEGLDFKCIRQVHILDPWYNMSRIEQIIGRAVRNKSHCSLELKKRNVEIYMHGSYYDSTYETADLYMYRLAEEKAIQVGKITRLLKETAVDCLLNTEQNNFTEENMNTSLEIELSTNNQVIQYAVGDKPFTSKCDYMDTCEVTCSSKENDKVEESSYSYNHMQSNFEKISKRIRQLYRERSFYNLEELLKELQIGRSYPIEEIYYTLSRFLENKNEWMVHKSQKGHLIRKDDIYVFQPSNISDTNISLYEREQHVPVQPYAAVVTVPKEMKQSVVNPDIPRKSETLSVKSPQSFVQAIDKQSHSLFEKIKEKIEIISSNNKQNKETIEYIRAMNFLMFQGITNEIFLYYVIIHELERMQYENKMICAKILFQKESDFDISKFERKIDEEIENIARIFFSKNIIKFKNDKYMMILVRDTSIIYKTWSNGQWKDSTITEIENDTVVEWLKKFNKKECIYKKTLKEFENTTLRSESYIGFLSSSSKKNANEDEYSFKIKNIFYTRNSFGQKCGYYDWDKIIQNHIKYGLNTLNQSYIKPNAEVFSKISKKNVCIAYEMLLRHIRETTGLCWFLYPEEAILSNISSLALVSQTTDEINSFSWHKNKIQKN